MARLRTLKPGFFTNEELSDVEPLGRLLFAALWTIADRDGILEDRPKRIKAEVLPYDTCDCNDLLQQLADRDFITRYEVDGGKYIAINKWFDHQRPHPKEAASKLPHPPKRRNLQESRVKDVASTDLGIDEQCGVLGLGSGDLGPGTEKEEEQGADAPCLFSASQEEAIKTICGNWLNKEDLDAARKRLAKMSDADLKALVDLSFDTMLMVHKTKTQYVPKLVGLLRGDKWKTWPDEETRARLTAQSAESLREEAKRPRVPLGDPEIRKRQEQALRVAQNPPPAAEVPAHREPTPAEARTMEFRTRPEKTHEEIMAAVTAGLKL